MIKACILEIYQDSKRFNRWYCRVIGGRSGPDDHYNTIFVKEGVLYDIPLNGHGRNKALHKVKDRLRDDGLDYIVLDADSKMKVVE